MENVYRRAVRANAVGLYALAVAAALAFPAHSAFAASTYHARDTVTAQAHAEVPVQSRDRIACTKSGCKPIPSSCHAAPYTGMEPGYSVIVCPIR